MEAIAAEQPAATLERKGLNGGPQQEAPSVISETEGRPDALEAARQWLAREHAATEMLFEQPLEAARGDSAAGPSMQPAGSHWQAPVNAGPGVREMGAAAGQEVAISLMNIQGAAKASDQPEQDSVDAGRTSFHAMDQNASAQAAPEAPAPGAGADWNLPFSLLAAAAMQPAHHGPGAMQPPIAAPLLGPPGLTASLQAWGQFLHNQRQPSAAGGQHGSAGEAAREVASHVRPHDRVAELSLFTYIMRCGGVLDNGWRVTINKYGGYHCFPPPGFVPVDGAPARKVYVNRTNVARAMGLPALFAQRRRPKEAMPAADAAMPAQPTAADVEASLAPDPAPTQHVPPLPTDVLVGVEAAAPPAPVPQHVSVPASPEHAPVPASEAGPCAGQQALADADTGGRSQKRSASLLDECHVSDQRARKRQHAASASERTSSADRSDRPGATRSEGEGSGEGRQSGCTPSVCDESEQPGGSTEASAEDDAADGDMAMAASEEPSGEAGSAKAMEVESAPVDDDVDDVAEVEGMPANDSAADSAAEAEGAPGAAEQDCPLEDGSTHGQDGDGSGVHRSAVEGASKIWSEDVQGSDREYGDYMLSKSIDASRQGGEGKVNSNGTTSSQGDTGCKDADASPTPSQAGDPLEATTEQAQLPGNDNADNAPAAEGTQGGSAEGQLYEGVPDEEIMGHADAGEEDGVVQGSADCISQEIKGSWAASQNSEAGHVIVASQADAVMGNEGEHAECKSTISELDADPHGNQGAASSADGVPCHIDSWGFPPAACQQSKSPADAGVEASAKQACSEDKAAGTAQQSSGPKQALLDEGNMLSGEQHAMADYPGVGATLAQPTASGVQGAVVQQSGDSVAPTESIDGPTEGVIKVKQSALLADVKDLDSAAGIASAGGAVCPAAASVVAEADAAAAAAAAATEVAASPNEDVYQSRTEQLLLVEAAQGTQSAGSNERVKEPAASEPALQAIGSTIEETQQWAAHGSAGKGIEEMATIVMKALLATEFKASGAAEEGLGGHPAAAMIGERGPALQMASARPLDEQEHALQPNPHLEAACPEAAVIESGSKGAGMAADNTPCAKQQTQPATEQPSHRPSPQLPQLAASINAAEERAAGAESAKVQAADANETAKRVSGGRPHRVNPTEAAPAASEDAHEPVWQFASADNQHKGVSVLHCHSESSKDDPNWLQRQVPRRREGHGGLLALPLPPGTTQADRDSAPETARSISAEKEFTADASKNDLALRMQPAQRSSQLREPAQRSSQLHEPAQQPSQLQDGSDDALVAPPILKGFFMIPSAGQGGRAPGIIADGGELDLQSTGHSACNSQTSDGRGPQQISIDPQLTEGPSQPIQNDNEPLPRYWQPAATEPEPSRSFSSTIRLNLSDGVPGSSGGGKAGGSGKGSFVQQVEPDQAAPVSMAVPAQQAACAQPAPVRAVSSNDLGVITSPRLEFKSSEGDEACRQDINWIAREVDKAKKAVQDVDADIAKENERHSAALRALQRHKMLPRSQSAKWSARLMLARRNVAKG